MSRKLDRRRQLRIAASDLYLEERQVGSRLVLDVQRFDQLEDKRGWIVDFLEKVDIRAYLPGKACLKRVSVTFSRRKLPCDVTIGDKHVLRDKPTSAHPVEPRSSQINTADRTDRAIE